MAAVLTLGDYLVAASRRPWRWGETDCILFVCDWIAMRRGVDPAAPWRGTYADADECGALLAREGGLTGLVRRAFRAAGLEETPTPRTGDVGLVRARGLVRPVGAIRIADAWAARTDTGLLVWPAEDLLAWRV